MANDLQRKYRTIEPSFGVLCLEVAQQVFEVL